MNNMTKRKIFELDPKSAIKVLELTKRRLKEDGNIVTGICYDLRDILKESGFSFYVDYYKLKLYIPLFTIENAKILAKKYNFKTPDGMENTYWWNVGLLNPRIKFINAIIKELKLKL